MTHKPPEKRCKVHYSLREKIDWNEEASCDAHVRSRQKKIKKEFTDLQCPTLLDKIDQSPMRRTALLLVVLRIFVEFDKLYFNSLVI